MRVLSKVVLVSVALGIALIAISTNAFQRRFAIPGPATKAEVERGRYLVEEVANARSAIPRASQRGTRFNRMAVGSADLDQAGRRIPNWADHARRWQACQVYRGPGGEGIGGWNGTEWTGVASPMQIYHMAPADARAIVAYLKSLPAEVH